MDIKTLIGIALDQLDYSYAPYSHFHVSAALETGNGRVFTGCNIENAAFTSTICAERTAFFKAVSEGCRSFKRIVIVGGIKGALGEYCMPCGVCRQVMAEFCDPADFNIIIAKSFTEYKQYSLNQLLPFHFGPCNLKKEERAKNEGNF